MGQKLSRIMVNPLKILRRMKIKNRIVVALLLTLNSLSCASQKMFDSKEDSLEFFSTLVVTAENYRGVEMYENVSLSYADSLNFYSKGVELPKFLFDYLFDFKNYRIYKHFREETLSLRNSIFDRVLNEEVLKKIIESKDVWLDKVYNPEVLEKETGYIPYQTYPEIPYMYLSTRKMAERRLGMLQKKKKLFAVK